MDIIKKYEPIFGVWYADEFIGAGSFGRVYKIKREELGTVYYSALKFFSIPQSDEEIEQLHFDGMDDVAIATYYEELVKDINEENLIMSRLKGHTNIVSYEDSRVIKKTSGLGYDVFIKMELLTSLPQYIKKHEFTRADVIHLGIDMCRALEICANNNIIHRDIKPDNIFINDNGDFKLGDFGIARTLDKTQSFMSKKGTYNYMAPEVYKGEMYDTSVDIYSLGMVMYRFMNDSRLPFLPLAPHRVTPQDKENSITLRMKGENMPLPCNAQDAFGQIILKACAFRPEDRFQNAAQMRMALEALSYAEDEGNLSVLGFGHDNSDGVLSTTGSNRRNGSSSFGNYYNTSNGSRSLNPYMYATHINTQPSTNMPDLDATTLLERSVDSEHNNAGNVMFAVPTESTPNNVLSSANQSFTPLANTDTTAPTNLNQSKKSKQQPKQPKPIPFKAETQPVQSVAKKEKSSNKKIWIPITAATATVVLGAGIAVFALMNPKESGNSVKSEVVDRTAKPTEVLIETYNPVDTEEPSSEPTASVDITSATPDTTEKATAKPKSSTKPTQKPTSTPKPTQKPSTGSTTPAPTWTAWNTTKPKAGTYTDIRYGYIDKDIKKSSKKNDQDLINKGYEYEKTEYSSWTVSGWQEFDKKPTETDTCEIVDTKTTYRTRTRNRSEPQLEERPDLIARGWTYGGTEVIDGKTYYIYYTPWGDWSAEKEGTPPKESVVLQVKVYHYYKMQTRTITYVYVKWPTDVTETKSEPSPKENRRIYYSYIPKK